MNWGHPERGKVLLLMGDCALAAAALLLATKMRSGMPLNDWQQTGLLAVYVGVYMTCFYIFDLYDLRALNGVRTFARLLAASISGTGILSFFVYAFQWRGLHRGTLGVAVPLLLASSVLWRRTYKRHRATLLKKRGTLFVGMPEDVEMLESILNTEHSAYELRGFMTFTETCATERFEERSEQAEPIAAAAAAGVSLRTSRGMSAVMEHPDAVPEARDGMARYDTDGPRDFGIVNRARLLSLAPQLGVDTIVLRQNSAVPELAEALTELRFRGIRISTLPDLCGEILEELPIETLSDTWFTFAAGFHLLHPKHFRKVKRVSDIFFAVAGLLLTLPLSALVAMAVKLESPGPVLFRQSRIGWMEKPFTLFKFRSMRQDAEWDGKPQWAAAMDARVTRVGRILRTLHVDEIPQMINVLLGEMSFVGPRPERPEFVEQLKELVPFYSLRHHVPPGITGWAQVNFPYGASVGDAKRKLQYDLFYVRSASPTMDLRILLRTARVILFRRGSR